MKKFVSLIVSLAMLISLAPAVFANVLLIAPAPTAEFTDVAAGAWYAEEVQYVYANRLMDGVGDGKFDPEGAVTRAMVWTVLAREAGISTAGSNPWYLAGQQWAIANGVSDGTSPEGNITREQLVTMIYRYEGSPSINGDDLAALKAYPDAAKLSDWAVNAMAWAIRVGLINGVSGELQPQGNATRAQLAAILYRYVETVKEEEAPVGHVCAYSTITNNGDHTHTEKCACGNSMVVACVLDENGYCAICGVSVKEVARIGGTYYETLAEAIAAAQAGDTVVLLKNIDLEETLLIEADKSLTLDLNGKALTYTGTEAAATYLIRNKGALIIVDNAGGGKVELLNAVVSANNSYATDAILNEGNLTVNGGTIKNNLGGASYAIDNNVGGTTVINGGSIINTKGTAIRVYSWSDAAASTLTVNGGSITGTYAVRTQNLGTPAGIINVTITGGTLTSTDETYYFALYSYAPANGSHENAKFTITGGTFNGWVVFGGGCKTNTETVAISGGTYDAGFGRYLADNGWDEDPANFLVLGYTTKDNGNGTFSVVPCTVSSAAELKSALEKGGIHKLTSDITLDGDSTITVAAGKSVVLDLNGHTISGVSDESGKNREMFLVKGKMTVKNGTITMEHTGTNMAWNNMTTIFDVTAGGELNIENATVENLGGTDMNFCVHLNNWGEVTLKVTGSTLKATYCAVRVFNSGYDMNNVSITNSALHGNNRAFWVHNYIGDLDKVKHPDADVIARLNINLINGTNTITNGTTENPKNNPIRYGFGSEAIYYDALGNDVTVH